MGYIVGLENRVAMIKGLQLVVMTEDMEVGVDLGRVMVEVLGMGVE